MSTLRCALCTALVATVPPGSFQHVRVRVELGGVLRTVCYPCVRALNAAAAAAESAARQL